MHEQCKLSIVTKDYLNRFYGILDHMIQCMTSVELSESISYNFIIQMIPHHCAAIEMSQNILRYTTNISVQNIATNIITMQTKSIENMRSIECNCKKCSNTKADICLYQRNYHHITQTMFSEMGNTYTTNHINTNFMREMIPHHRGAIRMAENALCFDICPQLVPILEEIISSQQKGIQEMNCLLNCMRECK